MAKLTRKARAEGAEKMAKERLDALDRLNEKLSELEDACAAMNAEFARNEIDFKAQANEIGFWKYECERYRDQLVALLRGKAEPP